MRTIGLILVGFGLALLFFAGYFFIKSRSKILSPIPEEKGVKVIFISPTQ